MEKQEFEELKENQIIYYELEHAQLLFEDGVLMGIEFEDTYLFFMPEFSNSKYAYFRRLFSCTRLSFKLFYKKCSLNKI
jgi:hypothetical protein